MLAWADFVERTLEVSALGCTRGETGQEAAFRRPRVAVFALFALTPFGTFAIVPPE